MGSLNADSVGSCAGAEWAFKGEGNANVVFSYQGQDENLAGHVLRLRKVRSKGPPTSSAAEALEAAIWQPVLRDWPTMTALQRELAYVSNVLQPQLGSCCAVASARQMAIPEAVQQQLAQTGYVLQQGLPGLLMPDFSKLVAPPPEGLQLVGPAVCVEIKPKAGCLPSPTAYIDGCSSSSSSSAGSLKRLHPRFLLHQLLKHTDGGALMVSRYNPLHLFSTHPLLQQAAVAALMECPSNNLKVFLDGALIFGGQQQGKQTSAGPNGAAAAAAAAGGMPGGAGGPLHPAPAAAAGTGAAAAAEEAGGQEGVAPPAAAQGLYSSSSSGFAAHRPPPVVLDPSSSPPHLPTQPTPRTPTPHHAPDTQGAEEVSPLRLDCSPPPEGPPPPALAKSGVMAGSGGAPLHKAPVAATEAAGAVNGRVAVAHNCQRGAAVGAAGAGGAAHSSRPVQERPEGAGAEPVVAQASSQQEVAGGAAAAAAPPPPPPPAAGGGTGAGVAAGAGGGTWAARRATAGQLLQHLEGFPALWPQQAPPAAPAAAAAAGGGGGSSTSGGGLMAGSHHHQQQQQQDASLHTASTTTYSHQQQPPQQQQPPAALRGGPGSLLQKELLLCRVLAGVLGACGVLPRLLGVQQLDAIGVEGAAALYAALMEGGQQQVEQQQQQQQQQVGPQEQQQQQVGQKEQQQQEQQEQQQGVGQVQSGTPGAASMLQPPPPQQQQQKQQQHKVVAQSRKRPGEPPVMGGAGASQPPSSKRQLGVCNGLHHSCSAGDLVAHGDQLDAATTAAAGRAAAGAGAGAGREAGEEEAGGSRCMAHCMMHVNAGQAGAQPLVAGATAGVATATTGAKVAAGSTAAGSAAAAGGGGGGGAAPPHLPVAPACGGAASLPATLTELLALPVDTQLELLRGYLTAVTAKDCALMVVLQQVVPQPGPAAQQQQQQQQHEQVEVPEQQGKGPTANSATAAAPAPGGHLPPSGGLNGSGARNSTSASSSGARSNSSNSSSSSGSLPGCCWGLHQDGDSGCTFLWQLSLVDLDLKPVVRIPVHAALDRRILAVAAAQPALLQRAVEDGAAWERDWRSGRRHSRACE